jgi:hypothetical protein
MAEANFARLYAQLPEKIAVHSAAVPQSNPNFSQFAPLTVVFWANSDRELGASVAGRLLNNKNNKKLDGCPVVAS